MHSLVEYAKLQKDFLEQKIKERGTHKEQRKSQVVSPLLGRVGRFAHIRLREISGLAEYYGLVELLPASGGTVQWVGEDGKVKATSFTPSQVLLLQWRD